MTATDEASRSRDSAAGPAPAASVLAEELRAANAALQHKATQLALVSKYKTDFLANMSHELRTPLNSLLILSDQLARNREGNLTPRQVEFARTIHSSGTDLLALINDILDLTKIESGTVLLDLRKVHLSDICDHARRTFGHVAEAKGVAFVMERGEGLPEALVTDGKRLHQILKNLLANAFKFTHQGRVLLRLEPAGKDIAFVVSDTGIGIAPDKQELVFEAFQQADGSTSRQYGGTGLGLAISRELVRLLGGEIALASTPGAGSVFTVTLPVVPAGAPVQAVVHAAPTTASVSGPVDGLASAAADAAAGGADVADEVDAAAALLVVAAGDELAACAQQVAQRHGWRVLGARGADALTMAARVPLVGVLLDTQLPDIDGWRLLDRFAHDLRLRHVPVCVFDWTATPERAQRAGAWGAFARIDADSIERAVEQLHAWSARSRRRLLVNSGDPALAAQLRELLPHASVDIVTDDEGSHPSASSAAGPPDLAIVRERTDLPPRDGHDALDASHRTTVLLRVGDYQDVAELAAAVIRHLHLPLDALEPAARALVEHALERERPLAGKRVLIVDDDMRNIFALATLLEDEGMDIVWADHGREAIERVSGDPGIEIVLMDLMMPLLDGTNALHEIRRLPAGRDLPVVVVTAKAMKGDREHCIAAGAWDYLAKPVHAPDLLRVMRAWLR